MPAAAPDPAPTTADPSETRLRAESTPTGPPLAGRLLAGRYRLNHPIASGGMAQVWEATDQTLARRVAVKVLHAHLASDQSFVARFRAEAVSAARLTHPSIVSVYDTFAADGVDAIVMELVVGTTLRTELDHHGPMRMEAVLAVGTQVADALGAAHSAGLVHRDVKPANILLSADGRVLVADFGIAKAAEGSDLTSAGSMVGTAKYLAPEQVQGGAIDGRADLYSLGIVLYEAITGEAPFVEATDAATALARLQRYPRPPRELRPDMAPAVEAVIMQAMARAPSHRFASAAAMRTALLRAGADPDRAPEVARAANAAPASATPQPTPPPPTTSDPPPPPTRGTPPPAGASREPQAPPAQPAPRPTGAPPRRRRRVRWLVVLAALAAMAGAFAVIGGDDQGAAVAVASITSFDPEGDNQSEREDLVALAIDGDPTTLWQSERYRDPAELAGKSGIGLVLALEQRGEVTGVDVRSPEPGWSAEVYVSDGASPEELAGWGAPAAAVRDAGAGRTALGVSGRQGDHVLVWFTGLPSSGVMQVAEVTVRAR